ncbi:MAG: hypothetical protein WCS18_11285 [Sphaerochaetaceae bacterium]|jgi:hypothetical protein
MNVRTIKEFYDREAGTVRHVGDEFEAGEARVAALASSLYGRLIEVVPKRAQARPKAKTTTRKKE